MVAMAAIMAMVGMGHPESMEGMLPEEMAVVVVAVVMVVVVVVVGLQCPQGQAGDER
jgi:hypothetical protein